MTAKLNDYAGAKDWRWQAMDEAASDLLGAEGQLSALCDRFVDTHTAPGEQLARNALACVRAALRKLGR